MIRRFAPFVLYTGLYAVLLPLVWYAIAPDSISYISIARHYAAGHWGEAVNAYWGPALSWIIAALLLVGMPEIAAAHAAVWLTGLAAVYALRRAVAVFGLSGPTVALVEYTGAAVAALLALAFVGSDVLMAAILLLYFSLIFDREYGVRSKRGLLCGVLGAAAYVTKSFGLPFFVAHFVLMNALHYLRGRDHRQRIAGHALAGLVAAVVLSAPWIAAVSAHTGKLTLGTSGSWNYRLVGPESPGYPQYGRLLPPPHPHALSRWEAPGGDSLPDWSPLASARNLKHQIRLVLRNAKVLYRDLLAFTPFALAIVLAYAVWGWRGGRVRWEFPVLTFLFLPVPYLLVTFQDRYAWVLVFLLLLMAGAVVQAAGPAMRGVPWAALAVVLFGSFLLSPMLGVVSQRGSGKGLYQAASVLNEQGVEGRLASCGEWNQSLELAYFGGDRFWGTTGETAAEAAVADELRPPEQGSVVLDVPAAGELRRNGVNYYVVWGACTKVDPEGTAGPEITRGSIPGLLVYRLAEK
mgnify:CR=1 FL=1